MVPSVAFSVLFTPLVINESSIVGTNRYDSI